jgi:uncharacterized RDD family membrane protein YckC
MKCPKCGYLGFEPVDRCRNCGYDFSLSRPLVLSELPIRTETPVSPLDDLALVDAWSSRPPSQAEPDDSGFDSDLGRALDRIQEKPLRGASLPLSPSGELPLFAPTTTDDAATVKAAKAKVPAGPAEGGQLTGAPPLPPLAVRRPSPGRPGAPILPDRREADRLERDRARFSSRRDAEWSEVDLESERSTALSPPQSPSSSLRDAGLGARFIAVAIDVSLLAIVDAVVVYFTVAICGLSLTEIGLLPIGPLLAFLLVQNLGYLIVFTAGGQTIGKMATGIKVVAEESGSSLSLGHALLRTLVWFVLAVPAGLGFLTALVSHDHRGLHDRFAGTRVIRASV